MLRFAPPFRGRYIASTRGGVTDNIARVGVSVLTTCAAIVAHEGSATVSTSIGVSASGQQTDQQHYGTATVGVVISSTASASVTSTHSGTATASIVITATAAGETGATHAGTASIGVTISASSSGTVVSPVDGTANIGITILATASGTASQTHAGVASCQVNLSVSAAGINANTTVPDETSNGNDMVLVGPSPSFTSDSAVGTRATEFNQDYSSANNNEAGRIDNNFESLFQSPFSFSAWIKPDDGQPQNTNTIFQANSTNTQGVNNNHWWVRLTGDGKILCYLIKFTSNGSNTQYSNICETTSAVFTDGAQSSYKHIAVTVDSSAVPTIYVNGTANNTNSTTNGGWSDLSNYDSTNDCVGVGGVFISSTHSGAPISSFDGKIDDVSLWSKELSSTEVSNIYNSGSGSSLTGSSDLEGWWKMGDHSVVPVTHSGTATVSVDVTASASGDTFTTHSGTASCQVNLSASASGTHVQGDESIVEGLSGKLCWFDANDITGSSNGDALSSWPSRHDSGVSASNSTSSTQPIYNTNQVNSLPAVNFDADYLEVDYGSNTSQPLTAFIVCAYDVTSGGGSNNAIDGRDNPSGYRSVNFSMRTNGWGSYAGSSWMQPSSGSPDTDWHYFTVYLNGASSYVRKDGASHATGNPGTQGTNGQILGMWKGKNTSYYMNGKIAEVLIFSGTLSDTNRNTTESYLKDKYNL